MMMMMALFGLCFLELLRNEKCEKFIGFKFQLFGFFFFSFKQIYVCHFAGSLAVFWKEKLFIFLALFSFILVPTWCIDQMSSHRSKYFFFPSCFCVLLVKNCMVLPRFSKFFPFFNFKFPVSGLNEFIFHFHFNQKTLEEHTAWGILKIKKIYICSSSSICSWNVVYLVLSK